MFKRVVFNKFSFIWPHVTAAFSEGRVVYASVQYNARLGVSTLVYSLALVTRGGGAPCLAGARLITVWSGEAGWGWDRQ